MTLANLAIQIRTDLGTPVDLTLDYVQGWLENNLGTLNTLLDLTIGLDDGSEADPELLDWQAAVYTQAFICFYYSKLSRSFLGTNAYDALDWTEVKEGDTVIKRRSKIDSAKAYRELEKDCRENLKELADLANMNNAVPRSLGSFHCLERYERIRLGV